jgi:hypothetical protein
MNRDTHWVHQRLRIMELPPELREKVAARLLTLLDVDVDVDVDVLVKLQPDRIVDVNEINKGRQGFRLATTIGVPVAQLDPQLILH